MNNTAPAFSILVFLMLVYDGFSQDIPSGTWIYKQWYEGDKKHSLAPDVAKKQEHHISFVGKTVTFPIGKDSRMTLDITYNLKTTPISFDLTSPKKWNSKNSGLMFRGIAKWSRPDKSEIAVLLADNGDPRPTSFDQKARNRLYKFVITQLKTKQKEN